MPYVGASAVKGKKTKPPGTQKRAESQPAMVNKVPPGLQDKGGMPPGQVRSIGPSGGGARPSGMRLARPDETRQSPGVVSPINPRMGGDDEFLNGLVERLGLLGRGDGPRAFIGDRDNFGQAGPGIGLGVGRGIPSPVGPQRGDVFGGGEPFPLPDFGPAPPGTIYDGPQMPYPTQSGPPMMSQPDPQMEQLMQLLFRLRGQGGGMRPMIPPGLQSGGMRPPQPRGIPFNPGLG